MNPLKNKRTRALAAAVEGLESRYLLSGAPTGLLAEKASTPLAFANASSTLTAPFTPSQVRQAYGLNQVADEGTGQTIAIIDAYNDPNLPGDVSSFDTMYGLAAFNAGGPTLTIESQTGSTTALPPNVPNPAPPGQNWDVEESLDVEWAHTVAPMANIILFEANSSSDQDLYTAVQTASLTPGVTTVSMSFSSGETSDELATDAMFNTPAGHAGETFVAATGDSSFPGGYPAVSPNVLGVGGTSLTINSDGTYGGESAWSGGGGNISDFEPQPVYQNAAASRYSLTQRISPDVSWLADPNTGVDVLDTYSLSPSIQAIGGTSLATPMWAALISIVDQERAGQGLSSLDTAQTHAILYNLPESDFNDITSGNNGYAAVPGYDLASGLGSPDVPAIVAAMTANNAIFVDPAAPGAVQNGASWTDAYTSLQQALAVGSPGTSILVAQGTYLPTSGSNQSASFQLQSGVSLLGGYGGFAAINPDASGAGFTTTLSGAIGGGNTSANSFNIVTASAADATAVLDGFTVTAASDGGLSISGGSGSPSIVNCDFIGNSGLSGGGVSVQNSAATFLNCTFSGNTATVGAGMDAQNFSGSLTDCTFVGNTAATVGGGIALIGGSTAILTNCEFLNNSTNSIVSAGGAVYIAASSPALVNCTFTANSSAQGGAIADAGGGASAPTVTNSILWQDAATQPSAAKEIWVAAGSLLPVVTFSDVQGGYIGASNINADPMFVNAAQGNLKLQQNSPCIDAGSNAALPAAATVDLAGLARIVGTIVDMGAFESQMLYVDANATGAGSGGTWANAMTSLAAAQEIVQWGQTIYVAGGTYYPTTSTDRTATFTLFDNVGIYGGFAGSQAANPNTRNIAMYPSILSGDIGARGNSSDNSYHVVSIVTNVPASAVLDGFTIAAGNADGSGDGNSSAGGGIFEFGGNPTLSNLTITANQANGKATAANGNSSFGFGGGMLDYGGAPTLTNCTFSNNTTTGASAFGGGIVDEYAGPELIGCTFSTNSCNGQANEGGAIFSFSSGEFLINCTFTKNFAINPGYGGAVAVDSSNPEFVNCLFTGNEALGNSPFNNGWGAAIIDYNSAAVVVTNCTFNGNFADLAGAIADFSSSTATVTNCILWQDSDFFGFEIYDNGDGSSSTVTYSDVTGGIAGTGNIDTDPLFASSTNLSLQPTSPAINVGNNAAIESAIQASGITTDIAGNPRIVDGVVDMGAYEAQTVDITWTGAGDGTDWSDPANWSDDLVPTQNDNVTIPAGYSIEIGGGAFAVASLTSSSPIEIQSTGSLKLFGAGVINGLLTIDTGGTLDIQNNTLTINYGSAADDEMATIRGYLHSAYSGGSWAGSGLTSSIAHAHPVAFAIGYSDNTAADQLTYQLTVPGDTDLSGTTDFTDLTTIAQFFGSSAAKGNTVSWQTGDLNYDGQVDFSDLTIVAQYFGDSLAKAEAATGVAAAVVTAGLVTAPQPIQAVAIQSPAEAPNVSVQTGATGVLPATLNTAVLSASVKSLGANDIVAITPEPPVLTAPVPTAPIPVASVPAAPVPVAPVAAPVAYAPPVAVATPTALATPIPAGPIASTSPTPLPITISAGPITVATPAGAPIIRPAISYIAPPPALVIHQAPLPLATPTAIAAAATTAVMPPAVPENGIVNDIIVGVWSALSPEDNSLFAG